MPLFTFYAYLVKALVIIIFFLCLYIIISNLYFFIQIKKIKKLIKEII